MGVRHRGVHPLLHCWHLGRAKQLAEGGEGDEDVGILDCARGCDWIHGLVLLRNGAILENCIGHGHAPGRQAFVRLDTANLCCPNEPLCPALVFTLVQSADPRTVPLGVLGIIVCRLRPPGPVLLPTLHCLPRDPQAGGRQRAWRGPQLLDHNKEGGPSD